MAAVLLQLFDLVFIADVEALEQKRCLQPRTIEPRNVHADRQLVDGHHLSCVHECNPM